MEDLEISTRSLFLFDLTPESPRVEGSEGIRLAAENLAYDGSQLSLDVLAAYAFAPGFAAAYQRLSDALVLGVENAETGAAAVVPLIDPRKTFPARPGPNFQGIRPWPGNKIGLTGGSVIMPLEISVPRPLLDGPSLYLTMFLQRHISNTLAIDLAALTVASFMVGEPFAPSREVIDAEETDEEDSDDPVAPPAAGALPARRALMVWPRSPGPYRKGTPILLDVRLMLPADEFSSLGVAGWLKSLFLWSSTQASQATSVRDFLQERTLFADDCRSVVIDGSPYVSTSLTVDLSSLFGLGSSPGFHYIYASVRQHRSEALEIECI